MNWSPKLIINNLRNGSFLTRDGTNGSYAIIRHNVRTYESAGVLAVIRGKADAELAQKKLEESQDPADRHEGWRYFIEKTDLKVGTDPLKATLQRQSQLEERESKAIGDATAPIVGTPNPPK